MGFSLKVELTAVSVCGWACWTQNTCARAVQRPGCIGSLMLVILRPLKRSTANTRVLRQHTGNLYSFTVYTLTYKQQH